MAVNPVVPYFPDGDELTAVVMTAAIAGKRLVKVGGARVNEQIRVITGTAAGKAFGVAAFDGAVGDLITVYTAPNIVPVVAGAAITAGQELEVGAGGTVVPFAAGIKVGYALDDAANGADCVVDLY